MFTQATTALSTSTLAIRSASSFDPAVTNIKIASLLADSIFRIWKTVGVTLAIILLNLIAIGRAEAADQVLNEKYRAFFEGLAKDSRATSGLTETNFSVLLSDLDTGAVIYTKNIDKPYAVGELSRLFLTFVLLKELGGDYQFSTDVFLDHRPQEVRAENDINVDFSRPVTGVGNMYIRGGGDPSLTLDRLATLSEELNRRGVTEVNDVLLDSSLAAADLANPKELNSSRSFPVDRGCLRTFVYPGQIGKSARVTTANLVEGISVDSTVTTGRADYIDVVSQFKPLSEAEVRKGRIGGIFASGIIGSKSELREICTPLALPDRMTVLRAAVEQSLKRGAIKFRSVNEGTTATDAVLAFSLSSSRLTEILIRTNTFPVSKELSEIFLQSIPYAAGGRLDPVQGREQAVGDVRAELGDRGGLSYENIFADGSTLLFSASDYLKFLQKALGSFGFSAEFRVTMPRVGEGELTLNKLLNPLYMRNVRGRDLLEKKTLIKSIRAFSSFSDNSTALIGIAELPGVRRIAFAVVGDGGSNKLVREATVFDLLKIALQLPVSIVDALPDIGNEPAKASE